LIFNPLHFTTTLLVMPRTYSASDFP
jgi:hypothetical protein